MEGVESVLSPPSPPPVSGKHRQRAVLDTTFTHSLPIPNGPRHITLSHCIIADDSSRVKERRGTYAVLSNNYTVKADKLLPPPPPPLPRNIFTSIYLVNRET